MKITKQPPRSWAQTWANYYSHVTRNMSADETHSVLSEERVLQEKIITRAEEHLEGVALYYVQSHLNDPAHQCAEEKNTSVPSNNNGKTIHSRELSDKEI